MPGAMSLRLEQEMHCNFGIRVLGKDRFAIAPRVIACEECTLEGLVIVGLTEEKLRSSHNPSNQAEVREFAYPRYGTVGWRVHQQSLYMHAPYGLNHRVPNPRSGAHEGRGGGRRRRWRERGAIRRSPLKRFRVEP